MEQPMNVSFGGAPAEGVPEEAVEEVASIPETLMPIKEALTAGDIEGALALVEQGLEGYEMPEAEGEEVPASMEDKMMKALTS